MVEEGNKIELYRQLSLKLVKIKANYDSVVDID